MAQARSPEPKETKKAESRASELTQQMCGIITEKAGEHTRLERAKFLLEISSKYKAQVSFSHLGIDFDSPVHMGIAMTKKGEKDQPCYQQMTLLELACANDTLPALLELIIQHTSQYSPNCVWLAVQKPDLLSKLLSTGKFDPSAACSFRVAADNLIAKPLSFAAMHLKSYDAAFILLINNADPITGEVLVKDVKMLALLDAAKELHCANKLYQENKFTNVLAINAFFTKALQLNSDFVLAYLAKALELLNSKKIDMGHPDIHLLKHYVKILYDTVKSQPALLNTLDKEKIHKLRDELMQATVQEGKAEQTISDTVACFFTTEAKKAKMLKRFTVEAASPSTAQLAQSMLTIKQ